MKAESDDHKKRRFNTINIAKELLQVQLEFSFDENGNYLPDTVDNFSLGYVVGFLDAMMQRMGFDDEVETFAMISILFRELYGEKLGPTLPGRFLEVQPLAATRQGLNRGGNDSMAWMKDPDKPPMGWFEYLS